MRDYTLGLHIFKYSFNIIRATSSLMSHLVIFCHFKAQLKFHKCVVFMRLILSIVKFIFFFFLFKLQLNEFNKCKLLLWCHVLSIFLFKNYCYHFTRDTFLYFFFAFKWRVFEDIKEKIMCNVQ